MNQAEEESLYHSLEEEAIDVDCLLVEPRSDQVSVSGVWCYEEDNLGKCNKTENDSFNLGGRASNINMEGVDTTNLNALDVLPHEVGVGNFLTTSNVSPCDDYLLDFGFDHGACIGYASNERLHVGNSQFPIKGSFEIKNSLSENISGTECQNYFLSNCISGTSTNSSEPKSLDRFDDFSKSFINQDMLPPHFSHNGLDIAPFCKDGPTSTGSAQDHGEVGAVAHKRSRKPTQRYIDESSILSMINSKKRREASSGCKGKPPGVRRVRSKNEVKVKPKNKMASSDVSFDKAIQVPFISQAPTECRKSVPPAKIESRIEIYSSGSEDDSEEIMRNMTSGSQRKLHRLWTVSEVKKLIDGVAHFGVGKWTHIKKLLFSSSIHRTPVDLKDKWRNLLKASRALKGSRIEEDHKRSQPWRPLPKSILCRVRELASVYPYPRENNNSKISKSKVALAHHVSSPARIKSNKVPVS
ncbi:putative transcription factor MYB-related family [Helianthus annuus]|uniref:Putative homeodomain-like protein n=1 Tax=Helianthus annuus TaxID=4232 RepID=A0A251TF30_HELAN|nr:uncharacterized protein LOC110891273 [Helianthus annuus]KAF5784059.1 putative transcription factor MYB-related family [Helianthus annuus]KAJ0519247.1 putative transcription factor MYB-HB-like family [Helianthus annuus]